MPTGIGGEIGWWCPSLDDTGNGTTTLYDLASSNNGTLTNMVAASDWVADTGSGGIRALDFDGTNDTVVFADILDSAFAGTSAKFSISTWFYNRNLATSRGIVTKLGDSTHAQNQRQFALVCESDKIEFTWFGTLTSGSFRVVRAATTIAVDTWTHVVVLFDATVANANQKVAIYVNGVLDSISIPFSGGSPVSIQNGTAQLAIGAAVGTSASSVTYDFDGRLDDVRVFSGLLNSTQISSLASKRGYQPISDTRRRRYSGSYGL